MDLLPFDKKKNAALQDPVRIEWARKQYCLACGMEPPSDPHHIKTRGSGGGDEWWNVIPLCRRCHTGWHQLGWKTFLSKNWNLKVELKTLGWRWMDGRLTHD